MEDRGIFSARPNAGTGRPNQADNEFGGASVIISVVENRAREICICKIDTINPASLEIVLLSDSHSYNETIDTIMGINPNEILLHDGTRNKVLSKLIEHDCGDDARVLYISRQYFDQDRGADMLKKVLAGDVDADLVAKYTVLSGAYCLLRYIENCSGSMIANHSMRVEYSGSAAARMSIDRRTAVNLELVSNAKNGNQKSSLFGAIDHTKTIVGARLLKSTILRPNTDVATINSRLDLVEAFLRNNRVFTEVVDCLRQFPDLDKMLCGLSTVPKNITPKTAKIGIDTLIFLKQTLKIAPMLATALEGLRSVGVGGTGGGLRPTTAGMSEFGGSAGRTQPFGTNPFSSGNVRQPNAATSQAAAPPLPQQHQPAQESPENALLEAIIGNLVNPQLKDLLDQVMDMITESTEYSCSSHEMRHQECFALKNGIHGLLDVARTTFLQTVEDIYRLGEQYSLQHSVTIRVTFNAARGYYLLVPATLAPLPPEFIQTVINKRTISCSTEELNSLSDRATEAITQALTLTHELTQDLLTTVRTNMTCLFSVTDCVALLDMLTSFADLVALNPHPFSRPVLKTDESPMVIKSGRHPVIASQSVQQLASSFVANDLFMSPLDNMHIITGPNGAGKTVYIKQVALIVIMAQIGCLVPARHATIPVRDRILSRIGTSDDIEHNMSTFATEMKEIAYILNNVTDKSLVIIDELGRGTSNIDGVSIAFAIAESLLGTDALTFFVTHYPQITALPDMYPNAKNVHLKTSIDMPGAGGNGGSGGVGGGGSATHSSAPSVSSGGTDGGIVYLHEVGTGPCDMRTGYGIIMAEQCGFPAEIVVDAREVRRAVRGTYPILSAHLSTPPPETRNLAAMNTLLQHLLLLKGTTLDDAGLLQYLHSLRSRISDETADAMLAYLSGASGALSQSAPALAAAAAVDATDATRPLSRPVSVVVTAAATEFRDDNGFMPAPTAQPRVPAVNASLPSTPRVQPPTMNHGPAQDNTPVVSAAVLVSAPQAALSASDPMRDLLTTPLLEPGRGHTPTIPDTGRRSTVAPTILPAAVHRSAPDEVAKEVTEAAVVSSPMLSSPTASQPPPPPTPHEHAAQATPRGRRRNNGWNIAALVGGNGASATPRPSPALEPLPTPQTDDSRRSAESAGCHIGVTDGAVAVTEGERVIASAVSVASFASVSVSASVSVLASSSSLISTNTVVPAALPVVENVVGVEDMEDIDW